MMAKSIKIVNWNIAWRKENSAHGKEIKRRILSHKPDIICLTETYESFEFAGYSSASATADYGYPIIDGRRKVRLFSKSHLYEIDHAADASLPTGRFVEAKTSSPIGQIRLIAVCIPWKSAHVSTGRCDRSTWEDHLSYLAGLSLILKRMSQPTILLGDFNQTLPRSRAPQRVFDQLVNALGAGMTIGTGGPIPGVDNLSIDHIAVSESLIVRNVIGIPNVLETGKVLSDHFGLVATISPKQIETGN